MHKGVILLTKANSKDDALQQVEEFLEPYGDGDVWDWYAIGGRWNNTLAPKDKLDKWKQMLPLILNYNDSGFLSQKEVDNKQEELQKAWEECGLEGENSYCNHYQLGREGNIYDVVLLKDCIEEVREWCKNLEEYKEEVWNELLHAKEKAKEGEYDMSGYYADLYRNAQYEAFCFETNVFNISTDEAETIPDDIDGYFAVMVDMHN